jgi:hypothetical protein
MLGMDRRQPKGGLAATLVAVLFLLAIYLAGYLSCPAEERAIGYDRIVYSEWRANLYAPAARIESLIIGTPVNLRYHGGLYGVPAHR